MIYSNGGSLDDLKRVVDRTTRQLRKHLDRFDFIAVRGSSGQLVGAPVSLRLNKPLVVVRKPGENHHAMGGVRAELINPDHAIGRYIFLDDFVSSGATREAVQSALRKWAPDAKYVGTYEYSSWADARGTFDWEDDELESAA